MTEKKWTEFKKDIILKAKKEITEHPYIRWGQAIFNISSEMFTEVRRLRATILDCFYDDDKVEMFLEELGNILTEKE